MLGLLEFLRDMAVMIISVAKIIRVYYTRIIRIVREIMLGLLIKKKAGLKYERRLVTELAKLL